MTSNNISVNDDFNQQYQALASIFIEQIDCLDRLLDCIHTERTALADLATETVIEVSEQKQSLMTQAETTMVQAKALIEPLKDDDPEASVEALFKDLDPTGDLNRLRERMIALTDRCLIENRQNSVQIRRQNQQVHAALCVLRGEDQQKPFYTAQGERSVGYGNRILGKA